MRDASLDILDAVRATLVGDAAVANLVGDRVTSSWSHQLSAPFIRYRVRGAKTFEADSAESSEAGSEITLTVHAFAKERAPLITHDLAAKIREALEHNDSLALDDAELWMLDYVSTAYLPDGADPDLQMAVLTFRASTTA